MQEKVPEPKLHSPISSVFPLLVLVAIADKNLFHSTAPQLIQKPLYEYSIILQARPVVNSEPRSQKNSRDAGQNFLKNFLA